MGRVALPTIRAAGGVVWRASDGGVEVAIIHRPRYDDWTLPKGKLASGESDLDGAVREVLEETGFHVRVGRPLGETRYDKPTPAGSRSKVVRWWAMQAEQGAFSVTREVDAIVWLSLADAAERVTRGADREVLERFARGPAPTRIVLLVRHALAGSSEAWPGDDRERPLDSCGIAQADELVRTLSRFEVGRIVSADLRRCIDTVQPLADAFGLGIQAEALLSEGTYPGREDEAEAMLRALGDPEHDAVACSQGAVIPDLLERMAAADGLPLDAPPRAPKGSAWALSLDAEGRLVALDFFPSQVPLDCR